jgi:hypothetical protein
VDWRNKKGFVKTCMKGDGPLGKFISQSYGGEWYNLFSAFTRKKKCKEAYQELIVDKNEMNKKKIKEVAADMIEAAEDEVKKLKVRQTQMPTKTVMNKLKRMNSWFNQFQNDLICQSYLEEGSEKDTNYKKCLGMISAPFRSLVKAREKGEAQWKSRQCERRMEESSEPFKEYTDEALMAFIEKKEIEDGLVTSSDDEELAKNSKKSTKKRKFGPRNDK